jgi:outer membrane protein OmpA-like peptidoglycan-associated protein
MLRKKKLTLPLCLAMLCSVRVAAAEDAPAPGAERASSLREQNNVSGNTGLLHLSVPGSGAAGTFRLSLLADGYSGSGFLCNASTPCEGSTHDSASHFGTALGLSVTPLPYLEAYASLRSFANSDDQHSPGLLAVLDNTALGAKLFSPAPIGGLFSVGGDAELDLLSGSGGVGFNGKGTSARLAALAELDFQRLAGNPVPLRVLTNLGYFLDNSGGVIASIEQSRGAPISRVERFGLGINRVDRFQTGLGVEGMFGPARPFLEWNLDIPVNRQNYTCNRRSVSVGDGCLEQDHSFSAVPSVLTLGARFAPWLKGLSGTVALDVGTSGTSNFITELVPTLPWDLWLGIGYSFDIQEPAPEKVVVHEPAPAPVQLPPKPALRARGFVHEKDKNEGIANAIIHYQGRDLTAMASGPDGHFTSDALDPGAYTLEVSADGFKAGQCAVTIADATQTAAPKPADSSPTAVSAPPAVPASPAAPPSPAPAPATQPGTTYFDVDCALESLPHAGTVIGRVIDADSHAGVPSSTIQLTDSLNRSLSLTTDENGAFRFDSVLPGTLTLRAESGDHLFHSQTLDLHMREEAHPEISLHKRPKVSLVQLGANDIKIKQQIHFEQDSATILGDSNALLEQIADTLARTPTIEHLEIQGHTDDTGTPEHNKSLSEARANAVLEWLVAHGIDANRLAAHGFGQERPLSPNVTPQGRARNRRVELIISH